MHMPNVIAGTKGFVTKPLNERFWAKVDRRGDDECWPWLGSKDEHGYGQIWVNGRKVKAAKVAWELANRAAFPVGKYACHSCDNPNCVNATHIWPGTPKDNMLDAVKKKRHHMMQRTHCPQGHPYDAANTILRRGGQRGCRTCKNLANVALRKRLKEERNAIGR